MSTDAPEVLVLGDVAWQVVLVPIREEKDRFHRYGAWIGAPLLKEMIEKALQGAVRPKPSYTELNRNSNTKVKLINECGEFIAVLASYPRKSRSDDKRDRVMRLSQDLRATERQPEEAATQSMNRSQRKRDSEEGSEFLKCLSRWNAPYAKQARLNSATPLLVVIYDRNIGLRKARGPLKELVSGLKKDDALILAIEDDLKAPDNNELDANLGDLVSSIPGHMRERTTILLTADSLRKFGLPIVEYGSIEQAVRDVVFYEKKRPLQTFSQKCGHLVVTYREPAVLYLRTAKMNRDSIEGSIHFCPNWDRIAQAESRKYGTMPGKVWIVLAALVRQIHKDMRPNSAQPWDLAAGIRLGVSSFNRYWSNGFGEGNPFHSITNALDPDSCKTLEKEITSGTRELLISSLEFKTDQKDLAKSWSRLVPVMQNQDHKDLLYRIVEEGVDTAFRKKPEENQGAGDKPWFPGYAITCPYAEFGSIKTVDEREIVSFFDLGRLIYKYLSDEDWNQPLSIAVFGPPGSGKSFAVKEILKSVRPVKSDWKPLTFNLAQFSSIDQLTEAFHQVQDLALSSDDVPLVVFDEFDSHFDGVPLGWLRYFLAPMQDGLFRGHTQEYRVGRSIFLFSGGTASNFEEFRRKLSKKKEQRAQVKLADFISRLRGHLDLSDINYAGKSPTLAKVRRAILLRSLLEKHAKPILKPGRGGDDSNASIQREVIDKFLGEWKYKHGVRSMEAVIQASRSIDGRFVLASLPAKAQRASHIIERRAGRSARRVGRGPGPELAARGEAGPGAAGPGRPVRADGAGRGRSERTGGASGRRASGRSRPANKRS